jgi:hypothetical protein
MIELYHAILAIEYTPVILAPLLVFAALQIADVYTTVIGMKLGAREENEGIQKLMDMLGWGWIPAKLALAAFAALSIAAVVPELPMFALASLWGLCALYVWVVRHNYRVIQERKAR